MLTPKTVEKEHEARLIINRIIRLLSKPPEELPTFLIRKKLIRSGSENHVGECSYDSITLVAFYDIIPTLIHEMIHFIYDDWTETKVLKTEKFIKRYITIKDLTKIIKLFANLL